MPRPYPACILALAATLSLCALASPPTPAVAKPDTVDGNAYKSAPDTYALTNARLVLGGGKVVEHGTLVLRSGRIVAAGAGVAVPADAQVIDGTNLVVYPALFDAYSNAGMPAPADYPAPERGTLYPVTTIRADMDAPSLLKPDAVVWAGRRKNGFAAGLAAPGAGLIAGTSAVVSFAPDAGAIAVARGDGRTVPTLILRPNVAMHASWNNPKPTGADVYPRSLMGGIAAIRQALYDAQDADARLSDYAKNPAGKMRPAVSAPVAALIPVVRHQIPFVLHAETAQNIRRALKLAREFRLQTVIEGGEEAGAVAGELKAAGATVLLTASLPEPPKIAPGETDTSTLQAYRYRATVPRTAAALAAAGVPFALTTEGLKSVDDYRKNIRRMIAAGLAPDTATEAATHAGAKLCGADGQIGTLAPGMLGNVLVTDGDLWAAKTKIRYLFVDGRKTEAGLDALTKTPKTGDSAATTTPALSHDAALKLLPPNVTVAQALQALRETPDQIKPLLPPGVTIDDAIAALEGTSDETKKGVDAASKTDPDVVTAPPMVGIGLVPPLPQQVPASFVLRGARVWTVAAAGVLPDADVYVKDGKIAGVGAHLSVPAGTAEIDARGKQITPGMIDCHSHTAISGGVNEGTNIVTAECRIADVIDAEDVNIYRQLAGGTTCANLLHGSANAIGGQNQVVKWRWGKPADGLIFAAAPAGIKFALGENPTQSNFDHPDRRYPDTRMGVERVIRESFTRARDYARDWAAYNGLKDKKNAVPPRRDLRLDALSEVLAGRRLVHCHSYRQDEILMMIRVAEDFGFRMGSFQHVMEGYKVADEMRQHGVGGSTFSDWWAYKIEVRDAIPYNGALMAERGVVVSFNSDSDELARRLNLEAAKAVHYGGMKPEEAIKFVTINPAKQLGIAARTGSLEVGKDADIAVWSGDPLSSLTVCEKTFVDGALYFDRAADLAARPALEAEKVRLAAAEKAGAKPTPAATPATTTPAVADAAPLVPPAPTGDKPLVDGRETIFSSGRRGVATVFLHATIHPVSAPAISNGAVVIRDGKILAVGAASDVPIPAGATVIDETGLHLYPGLFDADTQLGLQETESRSETRDDNEQGDFNPELRAAVAINPDSDLIGEARANGVLSVVAAPTGGTICGQGALLNLSGWTWEDYAVIPSAGMYVNFPRIGARSFRETGDRCEDGSGKPPFAGWTDVFVAPTDAAADARALLFGAAPPARPARGARPAAAPDADPDAERKAVQPLNDFLEAARRYQMAKAAGTVRDTETKWEAMLPVLSGTLPVYVRADREKEIRAAVAWAKANRLRLVLVGGGEADKCLPLLAAGDIPVILGETTRLPRHADSPYDDGYTLPAKLAAAHVRFAIATSTSADVRRLPWQAAMAASYGLDRDAALRTVTLAPAQITGRGERQGSLEPGKDATLIVTNGDPLEIETTVKAAYIRGEAVDLHTRQRGLYERYQRRPRKY